MLDVTQTSKNYYSSDTSYGEQVYDYDDNNNDEDDDNDG